MNETLARWIGESERIVFFGGAGVSTESGIPDFRSVDGLYNQKYKYPPETMLSASFFRSNPEDFYRFYHDKLVIRGDVRPDAAHRRLAELEAEAMFQAELQAMSLLPKDAALVEKQLSTFTREDGSVTGRAGVCVLEQIGEQRPIEGPEPPA